MNKTIFKSGIMAVLAMLLTFTFSACGPKSLSEMVEKLNAECPIESDGFSVKSVTLDQGNVNITYLMDESTVPVAMLKSMPSIAGSIKESIIPTLGSGDFGILGNLCIEEGAGVSFVLKNNEADEGFPITVSAEELKAALGK